MSELVVIQLTVPQLQTMLGTPPHRNVAYCPRFQTRKPGVETR